MSQHGFTKWQTKPVNLSKFLELCASLVLQNKLVLGVCVCEGGKAGKVKEEPRKRETKEDKSCQGNCPALLLALRSVNELFVT